MEESGINHTLRKPQRMPSTLIKTKTHGVVCVGVFSSVREFPSGARDNNNIGSNKRQITLFPTNLIWTGLESETVAFLSARVRYGDAVKAIITLSKRYFWEANDIPGAESLSDTRPCNIRSCQRGIPALECGYC